jgi:hypothetical protein
MNEKGENMTKAYLHFGGAACGTPQGPFLTTETEFKETDLPKTGQTVSGYGARIPTPYMVKFNGKWRRVYACCYGNAPTLYIGRNFGTVETLATVQFC